MAAKMTAILFYDFLFLSATAAMLFTTLLGESHQSRHQIRITVHPLGSRKRGL